MKWTCTLVVANCGRISLERYTLSELPVNENGMVRFVGEHGAVFWNFRQIRTMEVSPVKS